VAIVVKNLLLQDGTTTARNVNALTTSVANPPPSHPKKTALTKLKDGGEITTAMTS